MTTNGIPVDGYDGDCVVATAYADGAVYMYVERADERVRISAELLREIIAEEHHPWAAFGEGMLRLGTEGRGLGVITYEVDDPRFLDWQRGRIRLKWLTVQRVRLSENANPQ